MGMDDEVSRISKRYATARDILGLDKNFGGDLDGAIGNCIGYWWSVDRNETFDSDLAVVMKNMIKDLKEKR